MYSLPFLAELIEDNNEHLSNEQIKNNKLKKVFEYSNKFKVKCEEIGDHLYARLYSGVVNDIEEEYKNEIDDMEKRYNELLDKFNKLENEKSQIIIKNSYTNLPDYAWVINKLEDELNELKNENNMIIEKIKNQNEFNVLYYDICNFLCSELNDECIICDKCLKKFDLECESELYYIKIGGPDYDYGENEIDDMFTKYENYCIACAEYREQPLCSHCYDTINIPKEKITWINHLDKIYRENKEKNPNYKYSQAMKDAKKSY